MVGPCVSDYGERRCERVADPKGFGRGRMLLGRTARGEGEETDQCWASASHCFCLFIET